MSEEVLQMACPASASADGNFFLVAVDEAGNEAACVGPQRTAGIGDERLKHPAGCLALSAAFLLFLFCRLVHKGRYC